MNKERTTRDVWTLSGKYPGTGWEELTAELTRSEIIARRREYLENDRFLIDVKITKTREKIKP